MNEQVSIMPLGGIGDVTKNMYLYIYKDQVLIVDCGIGFADETMLGVDLLLPDISYLVSAKKKIVGMTLTHGHEDHIGALPFILPQLAGNGVDMSFPIYGTPLTAALANEKLQEYKVPYKVQTVTFENNKKTMGSFTASFIRVTHSVPDSSHIFIQTPIGNFYHGSDFKFDLTPVDGKKTDFMQIGRAANSGILCLLSDCLGSERAGHTVSEEVLSENFEDEVRKCRGKFIVTTYSSNISRLNQAISIGEKFNRKVCFVGKSLIKAKDVARKLGYMKLRQGIEIEVDEVKKYPENNILLLVAGSQGQENSALSRIANDEHTEISISEKDVVIFSADPIPGNEISVNSLIDTIAKKGARVVYSDIADDFHVSGHGSALDLMMLVSFTNPKFLMPISGTYRHMIAYKNLAEKLGYLSNRVVLSEDGQEIIFTREKTQKGVKTDIRNVYVDQITGEEVEGFVLRDRQQLSEGGILIVLSEVNAATGQLVGNPEIISRGFTEYDNKKFSKDLVLEIKRTLEQRKGRVTNWIHIRKQIGVVAERFIFKKLRCRPLVLPVVIEV